MLEDVREFNLRKTNRLQAVLMKFDDMHGIGTPDDLKKYIRK